MGVQRALALHGANHDVGANFSDRHNSHQPSRETTGSARLSCRFELDTVPYGFVP